MQPNKKLWIIIGLPGSGKTTLASSISDHDIRHPKFFEADMYFTDANENHNWRGCDLGKAHSWCRDHVEAELREGNSVIVSNTNLTKKERKPYIDLGVAYNAEIEVITCSGHFANIHNVPEETLQRMEKKFEKFTDDELK